MKEGEEGKGVGRGKEGEGKEGEGKEGERKKGVGKEGEEEGSPLRPLLPCSFPAFRLPSLLPSFSSFCLSFLLWPDHYFFP